MYHTQEISNNAQWVKSEQFVETDTSEQHDLYTDCVTEMLTFVNEEEFPDYNAEEIEKAVARDLWALTQGVTFNEIFWHQVNSLYEQAVKEIKGREKGENEENTEEIDEYEKYFYNHEKCLAQVLKV